MATGSAEGTRREGQLQNRPMSSVVTDESTCTRCGGLMVNDFCMDLLNSTGELEFAAKRCVQCGTVIDPVILHNRQLRQESMPSRSVRRSVQSMECEVGS